MLCSIETMFLPGIFGHSEEDRLTGECPTEVRTATPIHHNTPCNPHTGKPLPWVDPLLLSRGQDFPMSK